MRDEFLPFSRPAIDEGDIEAVASVLRSGWITTGPRTAEFEELFGARIGAGGSVSVASATAGMHLVLAALGIGPGDEVITPSMTWVSTVNLITLAGATPIFADIDRDTLMVTPETVRSCLSERTRLIIPVHFAGAALDLDPLYELAEKCGVPLVEDAAHAIGTEYRERPIGSRGTAIFSFHPIKNMTTGEGGMVCSDDAALLDRVRRLRFHGLGVDAFDRQTHGRAPQAEVLEPGYKYNLTDIASVLGCRQLARIDALNHKRAVLAERYRAALSDVAGVTPLGLPEYPFAHAWHLFIVRIDAATTGIDRDRFMEALKECRIGTGLHFRAAHTQRFYRENPPPRPSSLSNTEWNSERICSLPLFPDMEESDVDDVVTAIRDLIA